MSIEENLAAKLCYFLGDQVNSAEQWKLLGQESDGSLLLGWIEISSKHCNGSPYSVIGCYNRLLDKLEVLYRFKGTLNLIQATINQSQSVLGYIVKQTLESDARENVIINSEKSAKDIANEDKKCTSTESNEYYQAYLVEFKTEEAKIHTLESKKFKQIRIQFLYKEKLSSSIDKLLVLIHQEYVHKCTLLYNTNTEIATIKEVKKEVIIRNSIWAQWDSINQVLYHIHLKKASTSVFTEDSNRDQHNPPCSSPTLSGFQFHDDLPHETVLNIPLNLPQCPNSDNCGAYEDDVIPLRIHDCSLDLIVVSDQKGTVCVCHHYLYRPVQDAQMDEVSSCDDSNTVNFAYSVTLLHHSCVIHCVVPAIPWNRAKLMRPTFALYGEHHMIVFVPDCFTHLLEIGLHHQPCCHILGGALPNVSAQSYLVPLLNLNGTKSKNSSTSNTFSSLLCTSTNILTIDLPTLDLVNLTVPNNFLIDLFKKTSSSDNRLAILHYFLTHKNDLDLASELISSLVEKPRNLDVVKVMQEFLIGGAHMLVQKNLLTDAIPLLSLIPVTTLDECSTIQLQVKDLRVKLSHEKLWNTAVMLLSPQQRIITYRSDLWTKLWDTLNKRSKEDFPRFQPSQTAEKLQISLSCYQPEALSRCSTPMSPNGGFNIATATFGELMGGRHKYANHSALPFVEQESCTASKQEHIASVNLRELSLHLLKYGSQSVAGTNVRSKAPGSSCTPLHVHAMSTRYVATQFDASRLLCQMLCKAANVDSKLEIERGFNLIDQLDDSRRWMLFTLLERYRYATECVAYPVPQGFMSFFAYLGYRTMRYNKFLQYARHSVFELQVDVAKVIMSDIDDTKGNISHKLELLSVMPRIRAKRLLNQWLHPMSFMLRAREHAANILSGEPSQSRSRAPQHRHHHNGLSAFPAANRLSPLDRFFDLLTAKASLTELDFGLLIEATVTSTEDFL
ncbi:unnamed protein product [Trichogramma brassicae]|uniref:Gamma-secretase-activating protein C-terminal domain-containing protein n=1 Tax=Trichogramma brassicae TaxID=86971 RepID=A0A6H5IX73_9HYME|nr:unnamed protein product [Trichogramma brassicae]